MPRIRTGKKGDAVRNTVAHQEARVGGRQGFRIPPEPVSPPSRMQPEPLSPPPLPPKMPFKEMKRILTENKRGWVEAGLVPLPADEEGDFPPPFPGFKEIKDLPSDDYDPVIKKWNMYMNVCPDVHVMLLRYPEKMPGQLYSTRTGQKPLEMRIKPNFGLVEIDVPINPHDPSFDKVRGIIYGEAMRKSKILKEKGGSYGVAGGFGLGGSTRTRTAARSGQTTEEDDPTVEALLADYDNAVKNGHVMDKMTLGGHINLWSEANPNLFVATFKGPDAFFTKVNAMCVLRPQLVHLDALNDQNKSTLRMQAGADTEENEAVSVNMTIKKSEGESMESAGDAGEIAKLLKVMRAEPWQRLSWVDSEAQEAYDKFNKVFFAKNKAALPQLACNITNEQWLDTISCPRLDPINPNKRSMTTRSGDDDLSSTDSEGEYYTDSEDESEEEAEDESEAEVERATDKGDNDLYGAD